MSRKKPNPTPTPEPKKRIPLWDRVGTQPPSQRPVKVPASPRNASESKNAKTPAEPIPTPLASRPASVEDGYCPDPTTSSTTTTGKTTTSSRGSKPSSKNSASSLSGKLKNALAPSPTAVPPHLIVEARAGTGKTTTLIEGLKLMRGEKPSITPSPQQRAVWDQMLLSKNAGTICFTAFNVSIADELKRRVPAGVDAMTMHSLGNRAVTKAFGRQEPTSWAVQDKIAELLDVDSRVLKRTRPGILSAVDELVGLCKQNLTNPLGWNGERVPAMGEPADRLWDEELSRLASHYDVQIDEKDRVEVYQLVPEVLGLCKEPKGKIDFSDMIWLPIVLNLPLFQYDLLLGDEVQDWNRCQQALAKRSGRRLILVGDPKQAIYGWAGADSDSMPRMAKELSKVTLNFSGATTGRFGDAGTVKYDGTVGSGCVVLPLTVTRRCGKAIVKEAQKYVPDFEAHESNCEGVTKRAAYADPDNRGWDTYHKFVQDGDMVLCRVNAPLVSQAFKFIKAGRKATIRGRDVAKGLTSTVNKMKASSVTELITKLSDWANEEERKEQAKRNPSENRLIVIRDRVDCLLCFVDGSKTVEDVLRKIDAIFTDNAAEGILLSSVHKAKGLESKRVFFLRPKGAECPHPMAKTPWQKEQETHLLYVGITRAIEELIYVS